MFLPRFGLSATMKPFPSLCLIALLFICKVNPAWGKKARPNILFFLADDCSYLDLDLYGGPAKTPHINKLAKSGMTFNRCYQASAMCSPTRHCLYTGLYPVRSGAYQTDRSKNCERVEHHSPIPPRAIRTFVYKY